LLGDGAAFRQTIAGLSAAARRCGAQKVVAIESRGFMFGSAVAQALGLGLVPVRKKGKLPFKTLSATYQLEYGTDQLEMHVDALAKGEKVIIVDDVLATGGTALAVTGLVEKCGGQSVALAFVIELDFLKGREKLKGHEVISLIHY
jgi:adenine phosphoribosyltransferase